MSKNKSLTLLWSRATSLFCCWPIFNVSTKSNYCINLLTINCAPHIVAFCHFLGTFHLGVASLRINHSRNANMDFALMLFPFLGTQYTFHSALVLLILTTTHAQALEQIVDQLHDVRARCMAHLSDGPNRRPKPKLMMCNYFLFTFLFSVHLRCTLKRTRKHTFSVDSIIFHIIIASARMCVCVYASEKRHLWL